VSALPFTRFGDLTLRISESDPNRYCPFLDVMEGDKVFARIHWSAGYHTPEQDAQFRADAMRRADAIVHGLAACNELIHGDGTADSLQRAIDGARRALGLSV
jgi:hypothetical protein